MPGSETDNNEAQTSGVKCEPLVGVTDADKLKIALIWRLAAAAAVAVQTVVSAYISSKQLDLAKQFLNIAEYWRDWYNKAFAPLEDKEINELYAIPKVEPHYVREMGLAKNTFKTQAKDMLKKALRCTNQYDTGLRGWIFREAIKTETCGIAAAAAFGYRTERDLIDKKKDVLWKKFEGAVNRGRDIAATAIDYGVVSANIYGKLVNMSTQMIDSTMYFLSYAVRKTETVYTRDNAVDFLLEKFERLFG
jgi:hypothetical protein